MAVLFLLFFGTLLKHGEDQRPSIDTMNLIIASFCLKISVPGAGEIQALDSMGSKMEPKGVGGVPSERPFQT